MISGAQQGMTVMNISYKDLNVLEVPLPNMEKQKAVVKEYQEELKNIATRLQQRRSVGTKF